MQGYDTKENSPEAVQTARGYGLEVEVDLWEYSTGLFLGHDEGIHPVELAFLEQPGILVHCKNREVLSTLYGKAVNYFWHEDDAYTLTSAGDLLIHPQSKLVSCGILLMPELSKHPRSAILGCAGVCSNYPLSWNI